LSVEIDPAPVTTPEEFVSFINGVGFCLWQRSVRFPGLPSLEAATPWDGDTHALFHNTWFWKDDLHIEKRLYYGQILGSGIAVFASREMLPYLIAAQGDNDARTLYEKNRLTHAALTVYEHIERNGATASNQLPVDPKERPKTLVPLQQRFLLTKHGLTGRTRGTYGYIWGLSEEHFPDAFSAAGRLRVEAGRQRVRQHFADHGTPLTDKQAEKLFHWTE